MARGFLQELNLKESDTFDKDAKAINTLAGEPIAEDLLRYVGNLRNISSITNYTIDGDTITTIEDLPFANGNFIFYNSDVYYVFDSDVDSKFRLKDLDGVPFSETDNSVPLVRADAVFTENTSLLRPVRVVETRTNDGITNDEDRSDSIWEEEQERTLEGLIDDIEFGVANFKYKKRNTFVSFDDINTNRVIKLDGSLMITNPSTVPTTSDAGPGLFITDGITTLRAFSDNSNPWDPEAGQSPTVANTISIKPALTASAVNTIVLTDPLITMDPTDIITASGDITDPSTGWTHKIEVTVNGSPYYLLFKQ